MCTQTTELSTRIKDAERAVKRLVTTEYVEGHHPHASSSADPESQQHEPFAHQDAGSDDDDDTDHEGSDAMSVDALEDQFLVLEEEVATLVADVHDLALYTKLNITGFMKILKVRSTRTITTERSADGHTTSLLTSSRNMTYAASPYIVHLLCQLIIAVIICVETNEPSPQTDVHPGVPRETAVL